MSEIKLNLIDSQRILSGTIHASVGDRCVAALSAEPETIAELQEALLRYERFPPNFASVFDITSAVDTEAYDAGLLIIDLASRTVACDSTYSLPGPNDTVRYHDGAVCTDLAIPYLLPDDWLFVDSAEEYEGVQAARRQMREAITPLDARPVLYGRPLTRFIATCVWDAFTGLNFGQVSLDNNPHGSESDPISNIITAIHRSWLMTPRDDLGNLSPRDVMLAKQSLIDFDMETRALQWSFQLEGPPCLSRDSFAYRYAGFGTHEWVIYYDLIRYLLASALRFCHRGKDATDSSRAFPRILQTRGIADADLAIDGPDSSTNSVLFESLSAPPDLQTLINRLERLKLNWLSEPNSELDGHRPFLIIDNERKRLPEAMGGRSMVIDEDCPVCKMMGDEAERGLGVYFWHLDGGHFDQEFAFSSFRTQEEWQEHQKEMETFDREFQRKWRDGKADGGGEESGVDSFFDPLAFFPTDFKVEPPES